MKVVFVGALAIIVILSVTFVDVDLGTRREVALNQVVANVLTIFGQGADNGLLSTREWRLEWWAS